MAVSDPVSGAAAVTPDDDETIRTTSALWVGATGTLKVTHLDGSVVTYTAAVGWMPIRVTKVWATGTDATDIIACYNV